MSHVAPVDTIAERWFATSGVKAAFWLEQLVHIEAAPRNRAREVVKSVGVCRLVTITRKTKLQKHKSTSLPTL